MKLTFLLRGLGKSNNYSSKEGDSSYKKTLFIHKEDYSTLDEFLDWAFSYDLSQLFYFKISYKEQLLWEYQNRYAEVLGTPDYEIRLLFEEDNFSRFYLEKWFRNLMLEAKARESQVCFNFEAMDFLNWALI